jgi:hypothetical protein
VTGPAPLLDFFKKGEVPRDVRLLAAQGGLAARAHEQLAILVHLLEDADQEIRTAADATLGRIPAEALRGFLARSDVPVGLREFFADRGVFPDQTPPLEGDADEPLVAAAGDAEPEDDSAEGEGEGAAAEDERETVTQRVAKMGFTQRLKAAVKGSREMRAILIRDPNKMIAAAVLSSPKLTSQEVESIARMTNVSDEVLRVIANNRGWTKNYGVILGLVKNPKTPVAMSMNMMQRLNDRDLQQLSVDRNVPEPLRIAARKKVVSNTSGKG